ncbi:MAG TPA: 3-keto-5-aminohexanoate cleavage protein [Anaerovoracaceae bacterium]|nr:3-keto-5-aminohexanoate cleavage protein [Anaerovoracaceae bacterium]
MSNKENKVNWKVVNESLEKWGKKTIFNAYGLPEIVDPSHTVFALPEVDIQPAWDIPQKAAISTTIVGAFHSNRINPNHPMTPEQIYNSAREACLAGAPIVHIHVRNEQGYNVLDPELFKEVIEPLKKEFPKTVFDGCLVAGLSDLDTEWKKMIQVLESGLFDTTPVNTVATYCGDTLLAKSPAMMIEKARLCQEYGVKPQIAVYSDGDIDNAKRYLCDTGLLEPPYHFIILPAMPGCSPMPNPRAMVESLMHSWNLIKDIDPKTVVMVCAAGRASSYLATLSLILGLHVRIGMEDTVWKWPHRNEMIENNAQHFLGFKNLVEFLGREVATSNEYRAMIGLDPR